MSNPYFQFKQFTVRHDKCAMKVGTDGVLLGAWAPVQNAKYILDVGAGSGLISLQLAQRNPWASITSIEIDPAAAAQAKENIQSSPWSDRMEVICSDFRDYHAENKFDLIVSNPPYFVDALKCPDNQRCMARHTNELNYELLFGHSTHLLSEQGIISVIIPSEVEKTVIDTAWKYQLYPYRCLRVFTKPGKPYRRVLLAFSRQEVSCTEDSLYIEGEKHGKFTSEYISLTKEFYLKM